MPGHWVLAARSFVMLDEGLFFGGTKLHIVLMLIVALILGMDNVDLIALIVAFGSFVLFVFELFFSIFLFNVIIGIVDLLLNFLGIVFGRLDIFLFLLNFLLNFDILYLSLLWPFLLLLLFLLVFFSQLLLLLFNPFP